MKVLQFFTVMFVALSMGLALCHLMEMPVRLSYEPELWISVTVVENTYRLFGTPIGAVIESLAWIFAVILAVRFRKQTKAVLLAAALGAAFMVLAQVSWWAFVFPVNNAMASWTPIQVPENFIALRKQWEYAHGVRAVLQITSLACVVGAILQSPKHNHVPSTRHPG
jgi:hypothetical protein